MPVNTFRNNLGQRIQIGLRHSLYSIGAGLFFAAILYSLSTSATGPCSTTLTSSPATNALTNDGQIFIDGTELAPGDNWIYIYNVTSSSVIANTSTPNSSYTITGLLPGTYDIQVDRYDGTNTLYCSETVSITVNSFEPGDGTCYPTSPGGAYNDMLVRWTHNANEPSGEPAGHYKPELISSYVSSASDESPAFADYETAYDVLAIQTSATTSSEAILSETYIEYSFQTSATLPEASVLYGIGLGVFDSLNASGVYSGLYKIQVQADDHAGFTSPTILHNAITIDNENPTTGADETVNFTIGDIIYYYNHYQADNVIDLSPGSTYYIRVYFYDQTRNGYHGWATLPNYVVFDDISLKMSICEDADNDGIGNDTDTDDDNDGIPDSDECPIYGPELVVNGDFEDGYANWTSDFNRGKNNNGPTAGSCSIQGWVAVSSCASSNGNCGDYYNYYGSTPTGSTLITDAYGTGANVIPTTTCNSTANSCLAQSQPDHTTGTGFSVYVDPNDISGESYWIQTVTVEAGKSYEFSAWIMVIEEDPNLEFKIDGNSLTGGMNLDRLSGGSNGPDIWQKVSATWNSGVTSGSVILELVNTSAGCSGNDIRLDDISLREIINDCDMDGDGIPAYLDLDADNDGIPDIVEANGVDTDGDGRVDDNTDTDGDGIVDTYDNDDTDGPLVSGCTLGADCDLSGSTSILLDTNGDGSNDRDGDFDGDGIPNWLDLDSDDDGILDVVEGGGNDSNADGFVDDNSTDIDNDGFADSVDGDVGNDGTSENSTNALVRTSTDSNSDGQPDGSFTSGDFDGDGRPNFLDIDADDDGIVDNTEAQATDSYIAPSGIDADNDGVDDIYDSNDEAYGGSALVPQNTDGEDNYDYLDTDSDGDAELDIIEGHDSDGDGSADSASPAKNGTITGVDIDMDGLDDGFDNNTASTDPTNSNLQPTSHPIADAGTDRDWRYDNSFPVEWLSFTASWQGSHSLISWSTAQEMNSDYFEVERKISENGMFEIIGKVNAGGNTQRITSYTHTDRNIAAIAPDQQIFYRLRQVDFDGAFEYSDIVELIASQESFDLKVFPNPATDIVNIEIQGSFRENIVLSVTGMDGKRVYTGQPGSNQLQQQINVSQWAKGTYIVNVTGKTLSQQTRLVVR